MATAETDRPGDSRTALRVLRRPALLALPGMGIFTAAVATAPAMVGDTLPNPTTLILPGVVILLLIALNALFVAAEFAIIGVRPTRIVQLAAAGNRTARYVLGILESPARQDRYIATAQLGITLASLGLGMYGERQIAHFVEPYLSRLPGFTPSEALVGSLGYLIAVSLLTYLHVVLGEMIPKSLALAAAERTVLAITPPMRLSHMLFGFPVRVLNNIGLALLRLFRVPPPAGSARLHSPEEIEIIASESAESGMLDAEELDRIRNIFEFGERQIHQVMTPRLSVQAIAYGTPLPEILRLVAESKFSRFPVFEGDLDHVIGIIHIKDLARQLLRAKGEFDIRLLLHPALQVPEHFLVEKLLARFKRQHLHMAIVLNEFGGTAGVVTLEDLVEEIVGEVRDEFDLEREPLVQLAPGVLEVAGNLPIDVLQAHVDLGGEETLPDVETVGGLIVTCLGRPPKVGDKVVYRKQSRFTVVAVDGRAVARARIEYQRPGDRNTAPTDQA